MRTTIVSLALVLMSTLASAQISIPYWIGEDCEGKPDGAVLIQLVESGYVCKTLTTQRRVEIDTIKLDGECVPVPDKSSAAAFCEEFILD